MVKIIYHNDLDGRCAGYIAGDKLGVKDKSSFHEIAYGRPFPFDKIEKDEKVLILDYHIPTVEMDQLRKITTDIIWIDHHVTALKEYSQYEHNLNGLRVLGLSGCVLTYMYLYDCTEDDVPFHIRLIGDRDTWTWAYGEDTLYYCSGLEILDLHPLSNNWKYAEYFDDLIKDGVIVEQYKSQRNQEYIEEFGYITELDGNVAIAVNKGKSGSEVFNSVKKEYPLQILYVFDGESYKVSLRSKDVDVSEIALKYGGGGHPGAAGFECDVLPFNQCGKRYVADK